MQETSRQVPPKKLIEESLTVPFMNKASEKIFGVKIWNQENDLR